MCLSAEFGKVEVLSLQTWPIACENAGISACGLSIKLNGQGVNGDGDVGVQEALHIKRTCEKGSLGEIFVLCQGHEGAVEVLVWNKDNHVATRVGTKREDAGNGSVGSRKRAV